MKDYKVIDSDQKNKREYKARTLPLIALGAVYRISTVTYMFFKHLLSNPYDADEQMLSSFVKTSDLKLVVFERQRKRRGGGRVSGNMTVC